MDQGILREDTHRLMRLSAVDVLLTDKEKISDGLEAELYAFKEQLEREDADAKERRAGSLQVLPGGPSGEEAEDHRDVMF